MGVNYADLVPHLALTLVNLVAETPEGALRRIDHLSLSQADAIVLEAQGIAEEKGVDFSDVFILGEILSGRHVSYDRAVELRNRPTGKLVLLVPDDFGNEASSVDNPFKKLGSAQLVADTTNRLKDDLSYFEELNSAILRLDKQGRLVPSSLETLDFLSAIHPDRSLVWGEELWRIGLVPDSGPDAIDRLSRNIAAVNEISKPQARGSSISTRLNKLQIVDSGLKTALMSYLSRLPLHKPQSWTKGIIKDDLRSLTFDKWIFGSDTDVSLVALDMVPFIGAGGNPQKWSGLIASDDDLLLLPMQSDAEDTSFGTIGVKWKTNPAAPAGLSGFRVEVLPSQMAIDLGADPAPVVEEFAKATARHQRLVVSLGPEHAALGNRFVVRVSAIDENGQIAVLHNDDRAKDEKVSATVSSDEFRVEVIGFEPDVYEREPSVPSVTAARLDANLDGEDVTAPDKVVWDDDGQLLSVRFGASRAYSVRYSTPLKEVEHLSVGNSSSLRSFVFQSEGLEVVSADNVTIREWAAPRALLNARKKLFAHFEAAAGESGFRAMVGANWDSEAIALAISYLASFRRAIEAAEPEDAMGLLLADTLSIQMRTGQGNVKALVVLPSHPLRLGWMAKYEELMQAWGSALAKEPKKRAEKTLEPELAQRIAPANLPYILCDEQREPYVYHSELAVGSGLFVPLTETDVESVIWPVLAALRLPQTARSNMTIDSMLERKLTEYREVHSLSQQQFSVNAVNPADGAILASAIDGSLGLLASIDEVEEPVSVRVACFSERVSATDPVPKLRELQTAYSSGSFERPQSFLVPPFSLSNTTFDHLDLMAPANIGVLQGLSGASVSMVQPPDRSPLLRGLISPLEVTRVVGTSNGDELAVLAALKAPPKSEHDEVPQAHLSHQLAIGRALGQSDGVPGLAMNVSPQVVEAIKSLHAQSDWVVTIDRNVGATTFEELVRPHLPNSVLLDYAPEFVDGFSDRLSVTTTHRGEIDLALLQGMKELGLSNVQRGPKEIVKSLTDISGRLVLRLYKPNSLAREAVGLAAVMTYLESHKELENTIIIPLDAHPEIFSPSRRGLGENALRCDLMLIRLTRRSFKIELVEVKARKAMNKPDGALNAHIEEQLRETEKFLRRRVLPLGDSRIDSELQWVRAVSLMHFYAERAAYAGRVSRDKLGELHAAIARLGESPVEPTFTRTGYVVTLDAGATPAVVKREFAHIHYLTADSLNALGFSTEIGPEIEDESHGDLGE